MNHLTYPVVAPVDVDVDVCIVITAENLQTILVSISALSRNLFISQSSVEFGTEVELGILEKPAETISLVGREICVC